MNYLSFSVISYTVFLLPVLIDCILYEQLCSLTIVRPIWDRLYTFARCADSGNRSGLSFRELLYFLAAVDPGTGHGGTAAELRCRYMFK